MSTLQKITSTKKFKTIVIASFFILSAIVWLALKIHGHYYTSTEDAYINANVVQIAPRVTGKVDAVLVSNNQFVKQNQPLIMIDQTPFVLAVNAAKAELHLSEAELENASITEIRTASLVAKKVLSPQEGDNMIAHRKVAAAKVEQAKSILQQAELNLAYTHITAPCDGWITNLTLRAGDIVPANQGLFALISNNEFWVDANFKENEMAEIKPGQMVSVVTDMYPNHTFIGQVESISGGSGTAFSLLPPQNASGNWVKVTQRIPVRIRILHPDQQFPLRIGTSANVTVRINV